MSITDKTLEKHIVNNKVANSYLLIDRDIFKLKQIAEWFAYTYGVSNADMFYLVPKEGGGSIQVEATEEFIAKTSLAAIGEKKLYIICDAGTMTVPAQNKILKTIEDAGRDTVFMLLASTAETLLNTIKSRCVIVYPDPLPTGSLTDAELLNNNKNATQIFDNVELLLTKCKSLDDALPLVPLLTSKDNFAITMLALDGCMKKFMHTHTEGWTIERINAILKKLAIINRNTAANCNTQNAFDGLLIEIFKSPLKEGI